MRSRNIKPGYFKNHELARCHPLARILFAGLWCLADRDGRLEDRPERIKAELLPYDECDCDALLNELEEHEFVIRYQVEGRRCLQVAKFIIHQHPHNKEVSFGLPDPPDKKPKKRPRLVQKSQEITGQGQVETGEPSSSCAPHTSSLNTSSLNPSSLNTSSPPPGPVDVAPTIEALVERWNEIPDVHRCQIVTDERRKDFRARRKEEPFVANYAAALAKVEGSAFCRGGGENGWKASLDWFLKKGSVTKLIEGMYDDRKKQSRAPPDLLSGIAEFARGESA